MPIWSLALIFITVAAVSTVRRVKLQSTLYSLPIPLTCGLLGSGVAVSPIQPLSVIGPVGFFFLVAYLRSSLRWPDYPAALGSGLVILGVLQILAAIPGVTLSWAAGAAFVLWATIATWSAYSLRKIPTEPEVEGKDRRKVDPRSLVAVLPMLAIVGLTAAHLGSVGAMFPFAGMCVSIAVPDRNITEFALRFGIRSAGLVGFNTAYAATVAHLGTGPALAIGWITYTACLFGALAFERRFARPPADD